eukprot:m.54494 g.54494  ORF g.54494 m.54494 type:complete len:381 (-) comp10931_c1_seq3:39-1181(-)
MASSHIFSAILFAILGCLVAAQHHHHDDPFAGSNCTCDTFCANQCSINATEQAVNTYYRMTPLAALDMDNKNTGDIAGDTSFVLSRRLQYYECRLNPNSFYCNGAVTKFMGDEPNSTDLVIEFSIETDGQWGPYLYCNPVNTSNPGGQWACTTDLEPKPVSKVCAALNMSVYEGYCFSGQGKSSTVNSLGDCCTLASKTGASYTFHNDTMECEIFDYPNYPREGKNCASGEYHPPEAVCDCDRVHRTVGKRNLTSSSYSHYVTGGEWYSHPEAGECKGNAKIGDGGCTWRVVAEKRVINATCMYKHIDETIEAHDPSCFQACPQPNNMTSTCYLECFSRATEDMTKAELLAPWTKAFADPQSGGCPQVSLPPYSNSKKEQ